MILYNVTVGIDSDVEQEWIQWMREEHIPKVMETNMFTTFEMYKILSHDDEDASYSIQYKAESMDHLDSYLNGPGPSLIKEHIDRFKDKHVAFRTVLEKVG